MSSTSPTPFRGCVASLHLHPQKAGASMQAVTEMRVDAGKGIVGEPRYHGRISSSSGSPSRRQISLIEREQLAEHAGTLGLEGISPGAARSNIETEGIQLAKLIGHEVRIGEAVLRFYDVRIPCAKMDAICAGLRELMENGRQGMMAEVVKGGRIVVGDAITLVMAR
jgi:MOSC domain-containing protein YiiM